VRILLIALIVATAGCQRCSGDAPSPPGPAGSTDGDRAAAAQTVERYFSAMMAGDCAGVAAILQRKIEDKECDEVKETAERHPMSVVKILEVRPDGRERDVALVRVLVRKKTESQALYQVERTPKGWRLRL